MENNNTKNRSSGFVALMSVIVLSGLLAILILLWNNRLSTLIDSFEQARAYQQSFYTARSCLSLQQAQLSTTIHSVDSNQVFLFASSSCAITSLSFTTDSDPLINGGSEMPGWLVTATSSFGQTHVTLSGFINQSSNMEWLAKE